jgi:hypothetical protein
MMLMLGALLQLPKHMSFAMFLTVLSGKLCVHITYHFSAVWKL